MSQVNDGIAFKDIPPDLVTAYQEKHKDKNPIDPVASGSVLFFAFTPYRPPDIYIPQLFWWKDGRLCSSLYDKDELSCFDTNDLICSWCRKPIKAITPEVG